MVRGVGVADAQKRVRLSKQTHAGWQNGLFI
jgi:hypothetical protein